MAPLSRTHRKLYLAALAAIFAVMAPILIGYAQGYRLSDIGDALKLIRTGGIYVAPAASGVTVSIDGEERETTSFISRNALVQNLFAGSYHVSIAKPGYQTWEKDLQVYPELVTEWRPALVPDPIPLVEITKTLPVSTSTSATATPAAKPAANPRYAEARALFAPATTTAASAATPSAERLALVDLLARAGRRDLEKEPTLKTKGSLGAWAQSGVLRFAWLGSSDATPYYFCAPGGCVDEAVLSMPNPILWFDFAPGPTDLFVLVTKGGAWLAEADGRGGRNATLLMSGSDLAARVSGGSVFLRQGERYWEVAL